MNTFIKYYDAQVRAYTLHLLEQIKKGDANYNAYLGSYEAGVLDLWRPASKRVAANWPTKRESLRARLSLLGWSTKQLPHWYYD